MYLINFEINLFLNWSAKFIIASNTATADETTFTTTDTKFYVPVVTLSIDDNATLMQQLKLGFKRAINWNKYQSKVKGINARDQYKSQTHI